MSGALQGVVTLDGPSGTGKTTVARELAARLGAGYLDTGAMYRVVTFAVLRADLDPADATRIAELAREIEVGVGTNPDRPQAQLAGVDVSAEIRSEAVNRAVSAVAAIPEVRELLVAGQRRIIDQVLDTVGGIVVEGRDIGTVVAPDAPLKTFLTASPEVRADRRRAQDSAAGRAASPEAVRASVDRRDQLDSTREASPMRAAEDAVVLDTSELTIEQVIVALAELAGHRGLLGGEIAKACR